jgi:hypothetical protein
MSSLAERMGHFLRWFFNASPTAEIVPPKVRPARPSRDPRHDFSQPSREASR